MEKSPRFRGEAFLRNGAVMSDDIEKASPVVAPPRDPIVISYAGPAMTTCFCLADFDTIVADGPDSIARMRASYLFEQNPRVKVLVINPDMCAEALAKLSALDAQASVRQAP